MAQSDNSVGVIILGNSGVGKSFLGNVILGREIFKHQYQVNAVTIKTEYQESPFNGQKYAIYNIPGLIEAEQERIDLNKREIDVAFRQHPNAVVLYVFSTNNGRIRNEDIVAFNALNAAYPLGQKSLVLVINSVNPNRPNDYEAQMITRLSALLKMHLPHLCFVNHINHPSEKEPLAHKLVQAIISAMLKIHNKVQEIDLQAGEISKLTKQIAEFQKQIEQDREKYQLEMEKMKQEFEERERQQKAEQEARDRELRAEQQELKNKLADMEFKKTPSSEVTKINVSGAGSELANGTYVRNGIWDGKAIFSNRKTGFDIWFKIWGECREWRIGKTNNYWYINLGMLDGDYPPAEGWETAESGARYTLSLVQRGVVLPVPKIAYFYE